MAAALAGCDTRETEGAQGGEQVSSETAAAALTGMVDRTFAGSALPEVTLTDTSGESLELGDTRGTPVLLNLWATWCAPCVVEMPMLDELAAQKEGELRVVTVSQDMRGAEVVEPFFADREFAHLEPWLDPANDLGVSFDGGGAMPITVLYDANGVELFRVAGGYHWNSEEAIAAIEEALAE
jgi:thiol-disulfide isomerase/thioredoxin